MGVRQMRGVHDVIEAGARLAIADVVGDGFVEQDGFLGNDADVGAQ